MLYHTTQGPLRIREPSRLPYNPLGKACIHPTRQAAGHSAKAFGDIYPTQPSQSFYGLLDGKDRLLSLLKLFETPFMECKEYLVFPSKVKVNCRWLYSIASAMRRIVTFSKPFVRKSFIAVFRIISCILRFSRILRSVVPI